MPHFFSGGGRYRRPGQADRPKQSVFSILLRFWPFISPYRGAILFGMGCVTVGLALEKARPLVVRYLVDEALTPVVKGVWTEDLYRSSMQTALTAVGLMLVLAAAGAVVGRFHQYVMHRAGAAMVRDLRVHVYAHIQRLSLSFFDNRQTGEIMSRVTGDVDSMERLVTHIGDQIVNTLLNLVLTLCILMVLSWKLALVALIPVPLLVLLMRHFSRLIRPKYRAVRDYFGSVSARLQDSLAGIRVIKAFHTEEAENRRFEAENREYFEKQVDAMRLWTGAFPKMHFLQALGSISVTAAGAWMLLQPEPEITLGTLFAFNAYVIHFYQPIGMLFRMYDWMLRSIASGERILEVLETEPEVQDTPEAVELPPVKGEVRLESVSFRYATGGLVLQNVSLHARPGDTIALVGHSGAGKTSLVNLIPRFYDPVEGRVLIDGYDVTTVTRQSLRRQIAIVLQDPFLFNGTVKENIRYSRPEATDEEVSAAAEAAYAREFVERLPNGYDTQIGERGVKLSGGQKQRISIARALLADRRILILDEATAMVDSQAEYEIQQALRHLMRDRTTFVIAHRLSTVKRADQILTLEEGEIVERGNHEALVAQNGTYAQMVEAQFRLALEEP